MNTLLFLIRRHFRSFVPSTRIRNRHRLPTYCLLLLTVCAMSIFADDAGTIIARHAPLDFNRDGIAEIESLRVISKPSNQAKAERKDEKLLLVLVESRLLDKDKQHKVGRPLEEVLAEYQQLLQADGYTPVVVAGKVHASERHQDGLTVLAIRRLFQALKQEYPKFVGAVLVGSFPEATLVRRWIWKRSDVPVTFGKLEFNKKDKPTREFLSINPELISSRTDVVLCDLDGHWESLYRQEKTEIEFVSVMPEQPPADKDWPKLDAPFETDRFNLAHRSFVDFFYINDANYEYKRLPSGKVMFKGSSTMIVPETGGKERELPNPIACPDIVVSRINPLHVAVQQAPENLDPQGKPTSVPKAKGSPAKDFVRRPEFELRLLKDYFARNLAHRKGETASKSQRVALMTTDLETPSPGYFRKTAKQFAQPTEIFAHATALQFAKFIATPAIVKGVSAHSDPNHSVLLPGYEQAKLDAVTGGSYWHWKEQAGKFVPTYDDNAVRNAACFALLRTMWENGKLADTGPAFYVHGGCEAMCPTGGDKHPYNSPAYSRHTQIAECLMFYANGLALIGRAKVYFDIPTGFGDVFTPEQGCMGDVLREYFRRESQDRSLATSVASRNRTYFWSILGDWTLRMKYNPSAPTQAKSAN